MRNDYAIFFRRDSTLIRLPVNPDTLPVERGNENEEYNVLGIGPIMVPRDPSLRVVSISGLLPARAYSWVLTPGGFEPPEFYIQFFESAMRDKAPIVYTPVRYMEDGTPFATSDTGFECLVTQFDTEERAGETGDFYYDLEITEYKDYSPQTMQVQGGAGGNAAANGAAAASARAARSPMARAASQATAAAQGSDGPLKVTTERSRRIPQGQLYVGAIVAANGPYYQDSGGAQQAGQASGIQATVVRIEATDPTLPYPVFLRAEGNSLGWMKKEALQVVSKQ